MKVTRILICVDGSSASFQAARAAIGLAVQTNACLVALCIVDSSRLEAAGLRGTQAQRESDARAALDRVARMAGENGIKAEVRLGSGIVFEEILEEAREEAGRSDRYGPHRPPRSRQWDHGQLRPPPRRVQRPNTAPGAPSSGTTLTGVAWTGRGIAEGPPPRTRTGIQFQP